MASGTAASRITGQIRTILLAAALGTTGLTANAYQAGSMIPQVIYTLISGGIFNAVLVPQIVRTLKDKDAEDKLNKLITFAIVLLAGVTLLMAAMTPILSRLYVNGNDAMIALTNAFTLWCMPQIFFYGLYTVIGQVLAAKNHFTTYAWSSVGANIISCAGFGVFLAIFGHASEQPTSFWTQDKLALTAGMWTLGVAFQALVLFFPLMRIGLHYRPRFGVHGIGLRTMGPIAAWSFGIAIVDQLANILCTRMTTSAPMIAEQQMGLSQYDVAGNATYQNAYTIYLLPYSLIAVSVATAIFPQISSALAERKLDEARQDLSSSLRTVGVIMCFFTAAFLVMPLSITRALLPSVAVPQALLICAPLMALGIGLPLTSAYLIIQRTFYAFEDGRSPFIFMAIYYVLQLGLMYAGMAFLPPTQWVMLLGLTGSLGYILSFLPLVLMLRKRFDGSLDGRRIAYAYGKAIVATIVAVVCGLALRGPIYRMIGIEIHGSTGSMTWIQAVVSAILLTIIITVAYIGVLWILKSEELMSVLNTVKRRIPGRAAAAAVDEPLNEVEELDAPIPTELQQLPADDLDATRVLPQRVTTTTPTDTLTPDARPASMPPLYPSPSSVNQQAGEIMRPHLGDTVLNRYTLVSPLREEPGIEVWKASDRVLSRDCQLFIITNKALLPAVNATAGTLAASHDERFDSVLQLQHAGDIALVITKIDTGMSLSQYLRARTDAPLSYEAMRSIIAEAAQAVMKLQQQHLTHHALGTDTIRLTRSGVQLADTTVSAGLVDPSHTDGSVSMERLAICQLGAVLYSMLTRTPSAGVQQFRLSELPQDTPIEFTAICRRTLNMTDDEDHPFPLLTMNELHALLEQPKPLIALSRHDVRLTLPTGECSIVQVPIKPAKEADILPIPSTLISSSTQRLAFNGLNLNLPTLPDIDPLIDAAATDGKDLMDAEENGSDGSSKDGKTGKAGEGAGEKTQALKAGESFKALWDSSKAYMEGKDSGTLPEINPEDATEMFTAFTGEEPEPPMQPNRMTVPLDVSAIRDGSKDADSGLQATGRIPVFSDTGEIVPPGAESQRALDEERRQINATYQEGIPALPPSFTPQETEHTTPVSSQFLPEPKKKHKGRGRVAAIVVVAVLLACVLGLAIRALATGGSMFDIFKQDSTSYWPKMNLNDVPFGSGKGSDAQAHDDDVKQQPSAQPSETQKPENTEPYPISSGKFLDQPNGQQGYGYLITLDGEHDVNKVVISIRSSGGTGFIRVNTNGDPTQGEQVAQFTFDQSGTTTVKLDKTVKTQNVMLWVPLDSLPGNQLYINSMKAY